jgi:hypothetical protein
MKSSGTIGRVNAELVPDVSEKYLSLPQSSEVDEMSAKVTLPVMRSVVLGGEPLLGLMTRLFRLVVHWKCLSL